MSRCQKTCRLNRLCRYCTHFWTNRRDKDANIECWLKLDIYSFDLCPEMIVAEREGGFDDALLHYQLCER